MGVIQQKESSGIKWDSKDNQAGFYISWLDAGAYMLRDEINEWLDASGIKYQHSQNVKWFVWEFEKEENTTMFILRWS